MSTPEDPAIAELNTQIAALGLSISTAKAASTPKEEWDPLLQQMLALKAQYKQLTGEDHGPKKETKKPKGDNNEEASEKNKEKRAKKAAEKAAKEEKKRKQREEREAREREKMEKLSAAASKDWSHVFGDAPMIQSATKSEEGTGKWTKIGDLTKDLEGKKVVVRGHLHTSRGVGKGAFVLLRSSLYTVQCVAFESKDIPAAMIKYMTNVPVESIVDVCGILTIPDNAVEGATQSEVEIQVQSYHCVQKATAAMPFQMEDACRPDTVKETDVGAYDHEANQSEGGRVGQETRLDHRWIDLRTPANQSIFRIQSMVCTLFREYLLSQNFIEIHTPKLLSGASEGGADVFTLDYFGKPACLSMSPQLHKQMAAACGGFERVFEIGPVFRAENSNTRRHLCEFTGLDLEMAIMEHYDEVLDIIGDLFVYMFDGLKEKCANELKRVNEQHGFEELQYLRKTLKIDYATGCKLLREAGVAQDDYDDLSTENEKKLGDIVKEKYNTDFFIMDKYPLAVRPFYTMPDPNNPKLSNSYDIFIRGQEILSGAQRIHEPALLEERAKAWGIDVSTISSYLDAFRNGALPHGGGGIGMERVVMLYLGLPNIRKSSMFPRDPRRIAP
jgi:aspartyl-tRNA synthetase